MECISNVLFLKETVTSFIEHSRTSTTETWKALTNLSRTEVKIEKIQDIKILQRVVHFKVFATIYLPKPTIWISIENSISLDWEIPKDISVYKYQVYPMQNKFALLLRCNLQGVNNFNFHILLML
jgi:hypothetical protein